MTLIGTLEFDDGGLAFFGDAVASADVVPDGHRFWSPFGQATDVAAGAPGPVALVQKVVHVGKNAVLAWSGAAIDAIEVTEALLDMLENERLDAERGGERFVEEAARRGLHGFLATNAGGAVHTRGVGMTPFSVPGLRGLVAGSGSTDFLRVVPEFMASLPARKEGHPLDTARTLATTLLGALFANDLFHERAQLEGYGGAFEIAYPSASGFDKLDDFAIVVWISSPGTTSALRIQGPTRILGERYLDRATLACWTFADLDVRTAPHAIEARSVIAPHAFRGHRKWALEDELDEIVGGYAPVREADENDEGDVIEVREAGELTLNPQLIVHIVVGHDGGIHAFPRPNDQIFGLRDGRFGFHQAFPFWLRAQLEDRLGLRNGSPPAAAARDVRKRGGQGAATKPTGKRNRKR